MPRLLKRETQHRLTVSQYSLRTAFSILGTPRPVGYERVSTDGALEIGLIGVAADLAIASCLFELLGKRGIVRTSGFFLTASEALSNFRAVLKSGIPKLKTFTEGIADGEQYLSRLAQATISFTALFSARAAAVHAGAGVSHDVAFIAGRSVADFLTILGENPKWRPYLREIPGIPALPKDRQLIAEELAEIVKAGVKSGSATALSSIFLVLPELCSEEPEWVTALGRVQVAPRSNDITILLKSLQQAQVGQILKVGKSGRALSARIDPTNLSALPIYPAAMKKQFENLLDQWNGHAATANTELNKNVFSVPPIEAVYRFFTSGIEKIGFPEDEMETGLVAPSVWPVVAGALSYQGTPGPCFFSVRKLRTSEWGQFVALLGKAAELNKPLRRAIRDYLPLLQAAALGEEVSETDLLIKLEASATLREKNRSELVDRLNSRLSKLDAKSREEMEAVVAQIEETDSVTEPIAKIAGEKLNLDAQKQPIMSQLIDAVSEPEELPALVLVLGDKERLAGLHTAARKAIRDIDYSFFGPRKRSRGAKQ